MSTVYHIHAMLKETIEGLNIKPAGTYVDVTFGGGGHSRAIMKELTNDGGRLFSFDQDADALANAIDDPRWTFVHSNFRYLRNWLDYYGVTAIDGLLADLGVSFHHFDCPERGFSFRFPAPLDMRMNQTAKRTAADIVNTYSEEDLARIFYLYGELNSGRAIAKNLCRARSQKAILRTEDLVAASRIPAERSKELARLFQALRIEVNGELEALKALLQQALEMLVPGGRLVVISYHSLEDRIVKNFMRSGNFEGVVEKDFYGNPLAPVRQVLKCTASDAEVVLNNRARSAMLRVAEKVVVNV
jgi:16S rRNA (cytosine1402-N4)-methyltransferase